MNIFKLNEVSSSVVGGEPSEKSWYGKDILYAIGTSNNAYLLPTGIFFCCISIVPGAGTTGSVEYTLSTVDEIIANTATWIQWDNGVVSAYSDMTVYPPTAVRCKFISGIGQVKMEIKAG